MLPNLERKIAALTDDMFHYYKSTNYRNKSGASFSLEVKWEDFEQKMVIFGVVWSEAVLKHLVKCQTKRQDGGDVPEWLTM